jgi:hypothetical protein
VATANWFGQAAMGQFGTTAARRMDWVTDTVNCLLTTVTYTEDLDAHDFRNDVTNEVTGTNYSAGGVALSGKTLTYDSATNESRMDANDPTFTNITVSSIRKAVFYKVVGSSATDPLLFIYVFDGDQSVTAADFVIVLAATGAAKAVT